MLLKIGGATVGVVTGADITLAYEGGTVEHYYGSNIGAIPFGGKRATFRMQRWFMTDTDTDLLIDLFSDKVAFTASGEIDQVTGSTITLSGCKANSWRLIMGDANSVVGEEISGEGTNWTVGVT